ncbi:MAG: MoxR family ATPase [Campylobacterales bacterium]|nr:MoxR family ATPase [Campylobacterota bacterium]MBD3843293.1 MoxR family ATPase [Campylobacterales bacterium]
MTPRESIEILQNNMNKIIIGQEKVVERLIICMLADGNMLLEGLPGLAKTKMVKTMSKIIDVNFSRIQFTPDLVTSDIIGMDKLYEENGIHKFRFEPGPIFGNIILADEINRAPAKVQAAMLEAMEERQVTLGGKTYRLPKLFTVIATQNPLDKEGTYQLPDAQKDRFLMHVVVSYVDMESEMKIIQLAHEQKNNDVKSADIDQKISQDMIFAAREEIEKVKMSDSIEKYIIELVFATRYPLRYSKQLEVMIDVGVSPRASLALDQCARVYAWMQGRDYVTHNDVQAIVYDVFRHRLIKSEHTKLSEKTNDDIVDIILEQVPLP